MNTTNSILADIRTELIESSDLRIERSTQRFFKESILCYGVKSSTNSKIAKDSFKRLKDKSKSVVFELCEELWQSELLEETFIACNWSVSVSKQFEPEDFSVFEKWILRYVNNWASCDTLCNHTVGKFLELYPEFLPELQRWARSENRWLRRASAVSLIVPARKGKFLDEIFQIADILLLDKDDLVQKGYGWMLKVASKPHQNKVFDYVMDNQSVMPRTALRYAIEKMPSDLREEAMRK